MFGGFDNARAFICFSEVRKLGFWCLRGRIGGKFAEQIFHLLFFFFVFYFQKKKKQNHSCYNSDMKLCLVEDNLELAEYVKRFLEKRDFVLDHFENGEIAFERIKNRSYDLVILDIMLPDKSGLEIVRDLRKEEYNLPIIMLTALGDLENKTEAFESGADDYLVKPFELKELELRIRALLKRPKMEKSEKIKIGKLELDFNKKNISKGGKDLKLTSKEYQVLEYLMRNSGKILSRENILENCWDWSYEAFTNIVDVYIKRLRKKINGKNEEYIETIRGLGYKFREK